MPDSPAVNTPRALPPDADASAPPGVMRLHALYERINSRGDIQVQVIDLPADSSDQRVYDALIVSWARMPDSRALNFLMAQNTRSQILVTRKSLSIYVAQVAMRAHDRDTAAAPGAAAARA